MKMSLTAIILTLSVAVASGFVQAQTCSPNIKKTAPNYRFVDNLNGTVTDLWTGLMWKQCVEGMVWDLNNGCTPGVEAYTYSWQGALQEVANVNSGTAGQNLYQSDWRLPNVKELFSITEMACSDPATNEKFFPMTFTPALPTVMYWTSTGYALAGGGIWFVNFSTGAISTTGPTALSGVRLVRNAQ
jgi:hypothetical protein